MKQLGSAGIDALDGLLHAGARLSHRFQAVADQIHGRRLSGVGRRILRDLARHGPQTVPQMARARDCSRQHVQTAVNVLAESGYVELVANPAHRRSKLVRVTQRGRSHSRELQDRERQVLSRLQLEADAEDLRQAARVLADVWQALTPTLPGR